MTTAPEVRAVAKPSRSDKGYNIRLHPTYLLLNGMRGDFMFKVSDSWLVGPYGEFVDANYGFWQGKYTGGGVTSTYHFGRDPFRHSAYVSPEIGYKSGSVAYDYLFVSGQGDFKAYYAALKGGYHWAWSSFNLWVGGGVQHHQFEITNIKGKTRIFSSEVSSQNGSTFVSSTALALDVALGFAF